MYCTEDDLLWNSDSEESEQTDETDVSPNCNIDDELTQEEWDQLFDVSPQWVDAYLGNPVATQRLSR